MELPPSVAVLKHLNSHGGKVIHNYELFFPCAFPFLPLYYFYAEFQNRITTVPIISPKSADTRIFSKGSWHT